MPPFKDCMSLHYQLLTQPSTPTPSNSVKALDWEIAELLLSTGALTAEHFLEIQDDVPAWLVFVQKSNGPDKASEIVWRELSKVGYSWASMVFDPTEKKSDYNPIEINPVKTAFEALFTHCPLDVVEKIFATLTPDEVNAIKQNSCLNKRISVVSALDKKRKDLADFLIAKGWDIEQTDADGATSLLRAQSWSVAKQVLEYGANVLASTHLQKTVWDKVKDWSNYSTTATTIIGELKKYMSVATPKPVDKKKDEAIQSMFQIVASQKFTNLKRRWNSLVAHEKQDGDALLDNAGRSLARVGCDNVLTYKIKEDKKEEYGFFFRLANLLFENDTPKGWVDLSRPLDGFPLWTDRDHLYMTLSLLGSNTEIPFKILDENLQHAVKVWQETNFSILAKDFYRWNETFVPVHDKHYEEQKYATLISLSSSSSSMFRKIKTGLLNVPAGNEMEQKVLQPLVKFWEEFAKTKVWKYSPPAYSPEWATQWAMHKQPPENHIVWNIMQMNFLHDMKYKILERGQSLSAVRNNGHHKKCIDERIYMQPQYRELLKAWIDNILAPQEPNANNPDGLSLFERKRAIIDGDSRAFFEKIFLECELENLTSKDVVRRKM